MIKTWQKFIESISGTTDTMPIGPNFPRQELKNTISSKDTTLLEGSDGQFYTSDDFLNLFNQLIKVDKSILSNKEFNKSNLDYLIQIRDSN